MDWHFWCPISDILPLDLVGKCKIILMIKHKLELLTIQIMPKLVVAMQAALSRSSSRLKAGGSIQDLTKLT